MERDSGRGGGVRVRGMQRMKRRKKERKREKDREKDRDTERQRPTENRERERRERESLFKSSIRLYLCLSIIFAKCSFCSS